MLEFYFDFLAKYLNGLDFELCYIHTDSFDLSMSGDYIVKTGLRQTYNDDKKNWLATHNSDGTPDRTPGTLKSDILGTRGVWDTSKCYLIQIQNKIEKNKYSCNIYNFTVSKKRNDLHFES